MVLEVEVEKEKEEDRVGAGISVVHIASWALSPNTTNTRIPPIHPTTHISKKHVGIDTSFVPSHIIQRGPDRDKKRSQ